MNKSAIVKWAGLFLLMLTVTTTIIAQPGGPGGRPGGNPQGRPPMGGFDRQGPNNRSQQGETIRQKRVKNNNSTFKIVGTLRDSTNSEALMYVNIALLRPTDSSLVKGSVSDDNGYFEFKSVEAGKYLLKIVYVGYRTRYVPVEVTNNTALGTIKMHRSSYVMDEVTITAERPIFSMDGEKLVYNVTEDPSIQDGSTSDALQNAPGVEVDIEGNVTLRGVSSVEIWINDRPSKLTAENLKTYLETLPANALDRIETITNPSAKYATEADAVINIVTSAHIKKNHFISFGLNASSQPNLRPWVSYLWANEKLSVNIYLSGNYRHTKGSSSSTAIHSPFDTATNSYIPTEYDTTENANEATNWGTNVFANFDYTIDSMRSLSGWGSMNFSDNSSQSRTNAIRDTRPQALGYLFRYTDTNSADNDALFGMLGLNYTRKFDNHGHNMRLGARGNINRSNSDTYYQRIYETIYTLPNDNKYYYTENQSNSFGIDARYNRPITSNNEITLGAGLDYNSSNGQFSRTLFDSTSGDYTIIDTLRTYNSEISNFSANVDAGFTQRWGSFTMQLGMGVADNHISILYETQMPFGDDTPFNFITVRPSIHLSYYTKQMHTFKMNYTMRMNNPSASQLTTFRTYGEDSYSTGNPNLKSSRTHSFEAGWNKYFSRFGSVGVETYARYAANSIGSLSDVDNIVDEYMNRVVQYSMPYNMGYDYRYGATLQATYRPSGFANVRMYANIYNYGYHLDRGRQGTLENNKWSYSVRINAWAKVWDNYQIYASANYTSPTIGLASERKARYNLDFGIRADFFKRKMSAFINVRDIFNWGARYGSGNRNNNPAYISNSTSLDLSSRSISAGITFRFGKLELENKAKDGSSEDTSIQ